MKMMFLTSLLLLYTSLRCLADYDHSVPLNIYFFGYTEIDVNDVDGKYISGLNIPIKEYRNITEWRFSERSWSPDIIDMIVPFSYVGNGDEKLKIHTRIYEKSGPLVSHEKFGVTDLDKGLAQATWSKLPVIDKSIIYKVDAKSKVIVATLADISIRRITMNKWEKGAWPYLLKFEVWLECASCDESLRVEKELSLIPGD